MAAATPDGWDQERAARWVRQAEDIDRQLQPVSRLLFDNVPHVKVFWVMHGVQTAQLALQHGADDMDGSVVEYKITHDADNYGTPNKLTREDLLDLIRDAGFRPVERNTRYEIIREYDGPDAGRREEPQPMRV